MVGSTKHSLFILTFLFCFFYSEIRSQTVEQLQKEMQQMREHYNREIEKLREEVKKSKAPEMNEKKLEEMVDKYLKSSNAGDVPTWTDLISPKNKIKFYGFIRLDMIYDSHRTNNGNLVFFVNNRDASPHRQDEEINIHARLTRFGFDLNGGELAYLGGPQVTGKIELDFYEGASESRNLPRMRHAYLNLNWKQYDFQILAGQTTDLVSPLYPDSIDWNAAQWNLGNTGDRRPQLRLSYTPSLGKIGDEDFKLSIQGAVLRTEAVGAQDIDADGNNDGEDAKAPMLQWRIGLEIPAFVKKKPIRFGMWGSHAWEEAQLKVGLDRENEFKSQLYGIDLTLPIHDRFTVQSELWWGKNVNDLRGGIGQGINTIEGKEIEAVGGWLSAKVQILDRMSMSFGYSFDNPYDEDVEDFAGRRFNSQIFVNQVWDLGAGVSFGYEYDYVLTYFNRKDASNYASRGVVYIMYKF